MNILLHEKPILFDRIYPCITGDLASGIYLDHLVKKMDIPNNPKTTMLITHQEYKETFSFLGVDQAQIDLNLKQLPFIQMKQSSTTGVEGTIYTFFSKKYEQFMNQWSQK